MHEFGGEKRAVLAAVAVGRDGNQPGGANAFDRTREHGRETPSARECPASVKAALVACKVGDILDECLDFAGAQGVLEDGDVVDEAIELHLLEVEELPHGLTAE